MATVLPDGFSHDLSWKFGESGRVVGVAKLQFCPGHSLLRRVLEFWASFINQNKNKLAGLSCNKKFKYCIAVHCYKFDCWRWVVARHRCAIHSWSLIIVHLTHMFDERIYDLFVEYIILFPSELYSTLK